VLVNTQVSTAKGFPLVQRGQTISHVRTLELPQDYLEVANVYALKVIKAHTVNTQFLAQLVLTARPVSTEQSTASTATAVAHAHMDGREHIATPQSHAQTDPMEGVAKTEETQLEPLETADVLVSNISVESIVRLMTEFAILDLEEMIVRMEVHLLGRREIASVSVLWDGRTIIVSRRGSVRTSQLGFTVVFMVT